MNTNDRILKNQCVIMEALQALLQTGKTRGPWIDDVLEELSTAILESEPEGTCSIDDIPDE